MKLQARASQTPENGDQNKDIRTKINKKKIEDTRIRKVRLQGDIERDLITIRKQRESDDFTPN